MKKKTLEKLQEEHSEMCATAADLGMRVPEELTVDFDTAEVGATVCSNLDALIRQFRAGIDEKNVLARDDDGSENERSTTEAEPAKAAKTTGDDALKKPAKKTTAKKTAVKKTTAKKATTKKKGAPRGTSFPEDAKITWGKDKKNPAREGAGRHDRIAAVMKASGKTVKTFLSSGGNPTTLRNCVNAKLCSVA